MSTVGIVRLTSLGDVIHTLPVAYALRRHSPDTRVVWVAEAQAAILLEHNPAIDEFVSVPLRRWQTHARHPGRWSAIAREYRALAAHLRASRIEVTIDVQGLLKSAVLVRAIGSPRRIGFATRDARELSSLVLSERVRPPASATHIVDRNLSLLGPLGVDTSEVAFPLPAFPRAAGAIAEWAKAQRVERGDRLVALLPATRRASKQWPTERYLELATRLAGLDGVRIVVPIGPGEEALAARFASALGTRYVPIHQTSVPELVELFTLTALVVGNDTGPLHIAAAVGAPSVGLFGPTSGARNGPYGPTGASVQSPTRAMRDIQVEDVWGPAERMLARGRGR